MGRKGRIKLFFYRDQEMFFILVEGIFREL